MKYAPRQLDIEAKGQRSCLPIFLLKRFKRKSAEAPEACGQAPRKEKKNLRQRISAYKEERTEAKRKILDEGNGQSWFMEKFYKANEKMFRLVERILKRLHMNPDNLVEKLGYSRSFKIAKFASKADIAKEAMMLALCTFGAALVFGGIVLIVYMKNKHGVDITGALGHGPAGYGDVTKMVVKQSFSLKNLAQSGGAVGSVAIPLIAYQLLAKPLDIFQVILVRNMRKNVKGETPEKEAEIEKSYRGFLFNTYLEIIACKLLSSLPVPFIGLMAASLASLILEKRQLNFIKKFEKFAPEKPEPAQAASPETAKISQ